MALRAASRSAKTLSSSVTTVDFDESKRACDSASESLSVWATVEVTVEINVSLMVESSVEAPVSVIFGETGPSYSFT